MLFFYCHIFKSTFKKLPEGILFLDNCTLMNLKYIRNRSINIIFFKRWGHKSEVLYIMIRMFEIFCGDE